MAFELTSSAFKSGILFHAGIPVKVRIYRLRSIGVCRRQPRKASSS
jgi:hypothetical protein